jgi:N-acetylmuramoyl-L-alanine amidase
MGYFDGRKPDYHIEGIPVYVILMDPSQSNFPAYEMDPEYITIHETENHDEGADAFMHAYYLLNSAWGRQASWQFSVDDVRIVQHAKTNQSCWAAGDGQGDGNRKSINIETCENDDGDFNKTVKNVQALVRHLMKEEDIPLSKVVNHNKWSGKNCPNNLLPIWDKFISGVKDSKVEPPKVKPQKPAYSNNSIIDYLRGIGKDSSFGARKVYASQYGIANYRGTASQNLELLNKMRKGGPSRIEDEKVVYKGNSIVEFLNKIGVSSSYHNRAKLAFKYGIKGYRGTASQNLELLKKMQSKYSVKESSYKGNSIVDYLASIGESTSFSNRTRLANRHGISNYKGTASQNLSLLNKLRG